MRRDLAVHNVGEVGDVVLCAGDGDGPAGAHVAVGPHCVADLRFLLLVSDNKLVSENGFTYGFAASEELDWCCDSDGEDGSEDGEEVDDERHDEGRCELSSWGLVMNGFVSGEVFKVR